MIGFQELYNHYWIELIAVWGIFLLVITLMKGIRKNFEIARNWYSVTCVFLESQFSRSAFISKSFWFDSWNQFDIFSTGRKNCSYMYMNVICKPRQDFLTGILLQPIVRNYDKVYIEIPIDVMNPIVFLICNKSELKSVLIEYPEIEIHCSTRKIDSISKDMVVYSNSNACIESLLSSGFLLKFLNSPVTQKLLNYIYISDQSICPRLTGSFSKVTKAIKSSIKMPTHDEINLMNSLYGDSNYILKNLMILCDYLPNIELPEKSLQHISKNRREIEKTLNKIKEEKINERVEAKRREKILSEALKVSKMTPKEQKKYQEKKEKQQARSKIKLKKVRI